MIIQKSCSAHLLFLTLSIIIWRNELSRAGWWAGVFYNVSLLNRSRNWDFFPINKQPWCNKMMNAQNGWYTSYKRMLYAVNTCCEILAYYTQCAVDVFLLLYKIYLLQPTIEGAFYPTHMHSNYCLLLINSVIHKRNHKATW